MRVERRQRRAERPRQPEVQVAGELRHLHGHALEAPERRGGGDLRLDVIGAAAADATRERTAERARAGAAEPGEEPRLTGEQRRR